MSCPRPHEDPPQRAARLPARIACAIARLMTSIAPWSLQLDSAERELLARLVGLADKHNPAQPIAVGRQTLAERLRCSRATVQRLLLRLEQLGWIERDQIKSRRLGFQVGTITLSQVAVERLFDEPDDRCEAATQPAPGQVQRHPASTTRHGDDVSGLRHALLETGIQCIHRQPRSGLVANPHVDKSASPPSPRQQSTKKLMPRIPQALGFLLDVGISPTGLCALMRMAREQGQRLEDIGRAVLHGLRKAKNPFAYLRSLLTHPRDWTALAAHQQRREQAEHEAEQHRRRRANVDAWLASMEGRQVLDRANGRILQFVGRVALVFVQQDGKHLPQGGLPISDSTAEALMRGLGTGALSVLSITPD